MKKLLIFLALITGSFAAVPSVYAVQGGMTSWWVGSDYTNTDSTTAVSWTDRIGSVEAKAISATISGTTVYPTSNGSGGVVFTRTGNNKADPGSYFSTDAAKNPIAGATDFTILVNFTPTKVGTASTSAPFYEVSGLVAAEQGGVTNDWGLGYDANKKIISGYGVLDGADTTLRPATSTVELNTAAVAGMCVNGSSLTSWQDGTQIASKTITNKARNSNVAMYIGRMGNDGGYYEGTISEIRIFTRILGAAEIANYSDIMKNGTAVYTWSGGDGTITDANWTNAAGTTGQSLTPNSAAFIESGTVTMSATAGLKTLTVGDGKSTTTTATLNATTAQLAGAQSVILIAGGTISGLETNISTKNFHVSGGTLSGPKSVSSEDGSATLYLEGGTITAGGAFDVGGYNGKVGGNFVVTGGTFNANGYFCIGNRSTKGGNVDVSGGTLNLGWLTVGHKTTGTMTMTGGTVKCSDKITIGEGANDQISGVSGNGKINVKGGTLSVTNNISVGTQSTGVLDVSGGSVTAGSLTVTGNGTLTVSGSASVAAPITSTGTIQVTGGTVSKDVTLNSGSKTTVSGGKVTGTVTANSGSTLTFKGETLTGTVNLQSGSATTWSSGSFSGTMNVDSGANLTIPVGTYSITSSTGEAVVTLNGGTVKKSGTGDLNLLVGNGGKGKLVLNSGSWEGPRDSALGQSSGDQGTMEMNGGNFSATALNVGKAGTGFYTQTGGTTKIDYYFSIADQPGGTGTAKIQGGTLTPNVLSVGNRGTGIYEQTGGFVTANNIFVAENTAGSKGTLKVSGGVLKSNDALTIGKIGAGSMEISGEVLVMTKNLTNAQNLTFSDGYLSVTNSVTGNLTMADGSLALSGTVNGNLTQNAGTFYVGDQYTQALTWTRKTNNSFPGSSNAKVKDTSAATIADFWAKSKTILNDYPSTKNSAAPEVTTGTGKLGSNRVSTDDYTQIYDGMIYIESEGDYKFNFKADDGGYIYVDGECVAHMTLLDKSDPWNWDSISTTVHLTAGMHDFTMQYYQGYGGSPINYVNMQKIGVNGTSVLSTTDLLATTTLFATVAKSYNNVKISGDYTLGEDGELVMEVNGSNGAHDSLEITGTADLNGVLTINVAGDPTYISDIQLFKADDLQMDFTSVKINSIFPESFWITDGLMAGGNGFLRLDHGAVPEPAAWLLLLVGVCGVFSVKKWKAATR